MARKEKSETQQYPPIVCPDNGVDQRGKIRLVECEIQEPRRQANTDSIAKMFLGTRGHSYDVNQIEMMCGRLTEINGFNPVGNLICKT